MEKEKPNNSIIEKASVNYLKDALLRTEMVEAAIPDGDDKVPSWDGEIRLYSTRENFRKDTLVGKIPVQVKGTWVARFPKGKAAFSADVSDLQNYLNDGGIMFFLIQIKSFDDYKIYYTSLLPFDLRRLLDEAGAQRTKTIKLDVFPHKYKDGMLQVFCEFLENKKKQATLLPNIRCLQDLENSQMEIEKLEICIPKSATNTPEDAITELLERPQYVYARPKGVEASFAVDRIIPQEVVMHKHTPVVVDGEVLYDHIDIVRTSKKGKHFKLGDGITGTIHDGRMSFQYSLYGTLHEQICGLKFVTALFQGKEVKFGNVSLPTAGYTSKDSSLKETLERLTGLLTIDRVLKGLHVKKDLNFGKLSEHELQGLNYLVNGIEDGLPVPFNLSKDVGYGKLTIGNLTILLKATKNPSGAGVFISDFFATSDVRLTQKNDTPENGVRVSPYILMMASEMKLIDNFDLSEAVLSITAYPYSELYSERITNFVLELLRLYDDETTKDEKILDAIIQLLSFLQKHDSSQGELYKINRLQTEKRRRKLTTDEQRYLLSLKKAGIPLQYQLAASILLESFQEASLIYDQMDKEEKSLFDTYPIKHLWGYVS